MPAASVNTKLPVHWAPAVYIIVPGWICAVEAGAQAAAAADGGLVIAVASAAAASTANAADTRHANEETDRVMRMGPPEVRHRRGAGASGRHVVREVQRPGAAQVTDR